MRRFRLTRWLLRIVFEAHRDSVDLALQRHCETCHRCAGIDLDNTDESQFCRMGRELFNLSFDLTENMGSLTREPASPPRLSPITNRKVTV